MPTAYTDGASVYPACQNLLLAARALGYGGVHDRAGSSPPTPSCARCCTSPTRSRSWRPSPSGGPQGHHGPVRRRPLPELVYGERWGEAPAWAVDPDGRRPHVGRTADPQPIESAVLRTLAEG